MRALVLLALLALLGAACLPETEFRCTFSAQCVPQGTCQTAVGYCSFADSSCPGGLRFDSAAGPFSNQCVGALPGGDGGMDAPPIDGPPAGCPANYGPLPGGGPAVHLYAKAPSNLNWTGQADFCRGISPRAYLAVPDDATELMSLHSLAGATFWIGIDDRVTEGMYVKSTGGVATFLPWATGQPDNAGGGGGEDCVAATATTISDELCTGGNSNRPAVCECEP